MVRSTERIFFCTCGVGFDAFVSLKFAHAGKRGVLTYLEKTLQESLKYQPETYELETENGVTKYKKLFLLHAVTLRSMETMHISLRKLH